MYSPFKKNVNALLMLIYLKYAGGFDVSVNAGRSMDYDYIPQNYPNQAQKAHKQLLLHLDVRQLRVLSEFVYNWCHSYKSNALT